MSEFVIRPFAFMRLTHEALRAGHAALTRAAAEADLDGARREYAALRGVIALHARHEEEAFFPMLDRLFDGAVADAGLRETHEREDGHQAALEAALEDGDLDAIRAALDAWAGSFEAHLVREEEVMMPLTERVAPTLDGRAAAMREILDVDWAALERDHLPYVVSTLAATKPYGPVRMFVAALQAAAGDRYGELSPIVTTSVPAATAEMLRGHGHLGT